MMAMALGVAIVACQGAVGPPGPPGPAAPTPTTPTEPTTPTTPTPAGPTLTTPISDMTVMPGETLTVDLSLHFSGAIGYAAVSDMPDIASVPAIVVAGTALTVTAGTKEGSAMITVTASDSADAATANTAMDTFQVTVTTTKPTTLTVSEATELDIAPFLTTSQKAADYEVVSSNGSIFTAALKKGSVWTLTPKSHGMANAKIQNKNTAAEVESILVTVPNRAPTLNPKAATVKTVELVTSGDNTNDPVAETGLDADPLQVYMATADLTGQFTDPDGVDKTKLTYAITPSRSDVIISKGASCKTDMCALEIDVLTKAAATYFELTVVASDPGGLMSKELVIPVDSNDPLEQMYATGQLDDRFRPITVGYRESKHTLTFGTYADGVFKFVDTHIASLTAAEEALTTPTGATFALAGDVLLGKPSDLKVRDQDGDLDDPDHMIYVESSGTVKHGSLMNNNATTPVVLSSTTAATDFLTGTTDDPELEFTLVGSSGSGMITLTHYVWAATTDATKAKWVKSAPVTLKVTVVPVK